MAQVAEPGPKQGAGRQKRSNGQGRTEGTGGGAMRLRGQDGCQMAGRLRKGGYSAFNEVMTWGGFGGHWSALPRV
ncbi:unnamed protein product [Linum trigynum]|uniref:Uncharacterized protein n=1 Tax=Linum trigynum TaxID=586398 RepID=A0AAV2D2E9_9ROSI